MITDGYIDIHAHILPEVDDGSGSMEETLQMLTIAYRQGIRTIIATPHYACGMNNITADKLKAVRDRVQAEAAKIDKEFQIFLGNELYYSDSIIEDLKAQKALTLAESMYILVEFSVKSSYNTIYNGFKSLILSGYVPILAHVERYECLRKNESRIEELIELGAYIQMNSSSLLGGFLDSEAAYNRKLLAQGYIHLIGSDCHDKVNRIPRMEDAVKVVMKKYGNQMINQVFKDNPGKLLSNKYI
jgi:protein-tyrosine phosphatase